MSLSYQIKRARVRRYTPIEAATLAFLIAAAIIFLSIAAAWATGTLWEESATLTPITGQCWTGGCGRAEV